MDIGKKTREIPIFLVFFGVIILTIMIYFVCFPIKSYEILIQDSVTLVVGDRVSLSNKPSVKYSWTSSDVKIVTVDEFGFIEGIKAGKTIVKVKYNGKTEECKVQVVDVNDAIQTESITLDKGKYSLQVGDTVSLNYTIKPSNATNKSVTMYSSDLNVAIIENGEIVAKGEGTTSISVVTGDGNMATCIVEVKKNKSSEDSSDTTSTDDDTSGGNSEDTSGDTSEDTSEDTSPDTSSSGSSIPVESISLIPKEININVGETYQLIYEVNPSDASSTVVVWNSSDKRVATINNKGIVTGNKEGTATITVSSVNGKKDTMKVNVTKSSSDTDPLGDSVSVISISVVPKEIDIKLGETYQLKYVLNPNGATSSVFWNTSDNRIVSVNNKGIVTGNKKGTATITVSSENGKKDTMKVNVIETSSTVVNVDSISLDTSDVTMSVGDTLYVNTIIKPSNATNKNVTWTSGNQNVAVVKDGLVTAKWGGVSTITAKTVDGKIASFKVTVKNYNLIFDDGNFLTAKGTKIIKKKNGKQVQLRGFNLGVWLSRSLAFMPVKPIASSKEELQRKNYSCINSEAFLDALTRNVGGNANKLSNTLYKNFITEYDLDLIAQSGATVLRVPFEYGLIMDVTSNGYQYKKNSKGEIDFYYLDWIVEQCKKRGIYVILDLHLVPGRQNQGGWCPSYTFFENQQYQNAIVDMWAKVANHFSGEEAVAGYDIINEPQTSTAKLVSFYDRVYKSIRSVDKNHIIFMEEPCVFCGYSGVSNNTIGDLPNPSTKGWNNVAYSTHDYFYNKTSQGDTDPNTPPSVIRNRMNEKTNKTIAKSKKYNIPYYIGEFSHMGSTNNFNNYIGVWKEAMNKYDANNLNYTSWTYKAHWDRYYGNVFYGSNITKADIEKDSYSTIEKVFSSNSTKALKFNKEFYLMFLNQWKGRLASTITLSSTNLTLNVGDSKTINYTVNIDPNRVNNGYKSYDVINKKAVWSSSNSSVVSIDSNTGKMTAKSKGTATIKVTLNPLLLSEYTISANCKVTVK